MFQHDFDTFTALWLETAPDIAAVRDEVAVPDASEDALEELVAAKHSLRARLDLNMVSGAALVTFKRSTSGHWDVVDEGVALQPLVAEEDVIEQIAAALDAQPDGALVTFDGAVRDVPVLQIRAMLHRFGGRPGDLASAFDPAGRHFDLRRQLAAAVPDAVPSLEVTAERFGLPSLEARRFGPQSEVATDEEFALGKAYLIAILCLKFLHLGKNLPPHALQRTFWDLAKRLRGQPSVISQRLAASL